jgi:uncharacterized protein (TIGR03435 family)
LSLLFVSLILSSVALGQAAFDVASVKPHDRKDQTFGPPECTSERFRGRTLSVAQILVWAYDLRPDQYLALNASLPIWAQQEPYDFEAIASTRLPLARCKLLVQQLMVDRFNLKVRWKKVSNAPGYELRVASKGHKRKEVGFLDTGCGVHITYRTQERPCDRYQWPFRPKRGISMADLARTLTIYTRDNPIRDMTGLNGEYKISLTFALTDDDPDYPSMERVCGNRLGWSCGA